MGQPIPVHEQFADEQKEEMKNMYRDGFSQDDIARYFGVPRRTIMKLCKYLGLSRTNVEAGSLKIKSKLDNPKTIEIIKQMRGNGQSLREICDVVGGSISAINRICKKHRIGMNKKNIDYELVAKEYASGLNLEKLAKRYGVSVQSIHSGLKKIGTEFRDSMCKFTGCAPREVKLNKNELISDYKEMGSLSKVAAKHECTIEYVRQILKKVGVEIRGTSEILRGSGNPFYGKKHPKEISRMCAEIGAKHGKQFWLDNPEYAVKVAEKQRELWDDLDKRKTQSELISRLRKEGKCNSHKGAVDTRFGPLNFDSNYELMIIEKLEENDKVVHVEKDFDLIEYEYGGYKTYVPDFRIWLENGDFLIVESKADWYAKQPKEREKIKAGFNKFLDKFIVLNVENISELSYRIGMAMGAVEFNFNDIELVEVACDDYMQFYGCFHYMGKTGRKGYTLGAYLCDKLIACCTIGPVSRRSIAEKQNLKPGQIKELARFCIHPDFHKRNFGSWFLTKSINQYKTLYPDVVKFVSFADTTVGHQGTIYKAAGWVEDGYTKPNYYYVKNNERQHKKRVWDLAKKAGIKESEYASANGYIKIKEEKKLRFIYN